MAIVGRPNVGKSALFNRIIGRRLAIVHEESGVTRDRLISEAHWREQRFDLIDTGGLAVMDGARPEHVIAAETARQVDVALEDAAVVLFVVDLQAGRLPMDEEVARRLHQSGRPVFIAANKADNSQMDRQADEFAGLGFPVFPVSASHNRGVDTLLGAAVKKLPPPAPRASVAPLKVAVVGRPNVGKSSYINRLLGSDRVIVSEIPGTTRDSIEIPFAIGKGPQARHYLLIDTAGMRKPGRVHNSVEKFSLFRAEQSIANADVVVLMLDAGEGPTEQDKKIAAKIVENRKGCVLLVNKWDLAEGTKVSPREYAEALQRALYFVENIPVVFASAKSGFNLRKSIEAIDHVAAQTEQKLATGVLNRVLHDAVDKIQPPLVQGRRFKLFYATQTGTRPIRVKLFVNDPKRLAPAYRAYLLRSLRTAFGLEGAPVVLQLESSHKRDEPQA